LPDVNVELDILDRCGAGLAGIYLSVLGTTVEGGEHGEVCHGNHVSGIFALNRPRGSEAAGEENPVSHVGKIVVRELERVIRFCQNLAAGKFSMC